jgi:hypothetical protein
LLEKGWKEDRDKEERNEKRRGKKEEKDSGEGEEKGKKKGRRKGSSISLILLVSLREDTKNKERT